MTWGVSAGAASFWTVLYWQMPLAAWVGHAVLGVLLVMLCGRWLAGRRAAPRWEGLVPWVATAAVGAVVAGHARQLFSIWAMGTESQWARLFLVLRGLAELLPVVAWSVPMALAFWSALLAWSLGRALGAVGRWCVAVGLVVWVGPGLGAASVGVATYSHRVFGAFTADHGHGMAVAAAVPQRADLMRAFTVAGVALGLGVGCVALGILVSGSREPEPVSGAQEARRRWLPWLETSLYVLFAGALSAALLGVGLPLAGENAHPIDPRFSYVDCGLCFPPPLAVEGRGPYAPREATLVELGARTDLIDGIPTSSELYDILKNKRELWKQINAGRPFLGVVAMNAAGIGWASELESRLATAYWAGYPEVDLLFTEQHFEVRPLLGEGWGRRDTTLRLRVARFPTECGSASRQYVQAGLSAEEPLADFLEDLARRHADGSVPCILLLPWLWNPHENRGDGFYDRGWRVLEEHALDDSRLVARVRRASVEAAMMFVPARGLEQDLRDDTRRVAWVRSGQAEPSLVVVPARDSPFGTALSAFDDLAWFVKAEWVWGEDPLEDPSLLAVRRGPLLLRHGDVAPELAGGKGGRKFRSAVGIRGNVGEEWLVLVVSTTEVTWTELATLLFDLGFPDARGSAGPPRHGAVLASMAGGLGEDVSASVAQSR
jgi:hypothetical protein